MLNKQNSKVPKIIWILWFQGFDNAPYVVKKCLASWKKYNPDWKINLLEEANISEYINLNELVGKNVQEITKQALSDVLRINLLEKYGGVWTDATCFCNKPLDEWLSSYMGSGFFAFRNPENDRPISSWFLASAKNCQLTSKYCEIVNNYWDRNRFTNQNNRIGRFASTHFENRIKLSDYKSKRFRKLFFAIKILKMFPYFWFHYLFAKTIEKDKASKELWGSAKKYSADIPHKLLSSGLFKPLSDELKHTIDTREDPLYKLTWKYTETEFVKGCTLDYLLHTI